jgi:hypothetical protein
MVYAENADFEVVLLPIKEDFQFNVEKAMEYFNKVEGLGYGYHNFLFSLLDTKKDNFPLPMSAELFPLVLRYVE